MTFRTEPRPEPASSTSLLDARGFDSTMVELLRRRAAGCDGSPFYTFLPDGEREGPSLSLSALDARARALAAEFATSTPRGERALLLYPSGLEFIEAFFGCLYAGVLAVPLYPPDPTRPARVLRRIGAIARDAQPAVVLTTSAALGALPSLAAESPDLAPLRWSATDAVDTGAASRWVDPQVAPEDIAFLQYTSGSTGTPKGVMVSHTNLVHNVDALRRAFYFDADTIMVSWLPLYHDMGLIAAVLSPLLAGRRCVFMPPQVFVKHPLRWLRVLSRYRASVSFAPNFAFDLCVRKTTPAQREELDLSSWKAAVNGAEPIRPETLSSFVETFAPQGFRPDAFRPGFGLAENTVCVSGQRGEGEPLVLDLDPEALTKNRVRSAPSGAPSVRRAVGCGAPPSGIEVAIVDPETGSRCPADGVGEIWVAGSSVAQGYWQRTEETGRTFRASIAGEEGRYLRTGDLGFLHAGQLFVTGRLKDLIIVGGQNHYPQDIERTIEHSEPLVRPGCIAVFPIDVEGRESVAVAVELLEPAASDPAGQKAVAEVIRRSVSAAHDLEVGGIAFLKPGTIPKTSSGKIQRRACRDGFLTGTLDAIR